MQYATTLDVRELGEEFDALSEIEPRTDEEDARLACLEHLHSQLDVTMSLQEFGDGYEPTLILASDFELYAQELAEDVGAVMTDPAWPYTCIDWEYAARELAYDYTTVTFDGADYMIRSY